MLIDMRIVRRYPQISATNELTAMGLYEDNVGTFGASALSGQNGKPLTGRLLANRIEKLEKERLDAEHAKGAAPRADTWNEAIQTMTDQPSVERTTAAAPPVAQTAQAAAFAVSRARFAVDKGVPMPDKADRGQRADTKYPYRDMTEVGDSFFVPVSAEVPKPWKTLSSLSSRMSKDLFPRTFQAVRVNATADGTPEGCRVYRVEDLKEPRTPRPPRAKKEEAAK